MINRRGGKALRRGGDRGTCRSAAATSRPAARLQGIGRAGESCSNPTLQCRGCGRAIAEPRRPDPVGARSGAVGPGLGG